MDHIYAFTDEYGAFGWDIDNPSVSTHFIITAILVKDCDLSTFAKLAEEIRRKHFQTGEIKSSKIGKNHDRRLRILEDIQSLPFSFFTVCIDKQKCIDNMSLQGLKYKKTFYKFMNNLVHSELRRAFQSITVVADEIGSNDYMKSFCEYVSARQEAKSFFGDVEFSFECSHDDVRIQIAYLISGTLSYVFDKHKHLPDTPDYLKILQPKINKIELFPKTFDTYVFEESAIADTYDRTIAKICFGQAAAFIENHSSSSDSEVNAQIIILQYLLFRFMNNNNRGYIYTKELIRQLENTEFRNISEQNFRGKIIGKLRDEGVIIASSLKGYKIPCTQQELYDFINHDAKIVIPMLARLQKCRDLIKLGTANELDLLDHTEYRKLRTYFDLISTD